MLTDLSDVKNKALIAELTEGQDVEDLINGIQGKVANTIHPDDLERVGEELNHGDYYEGMTYKITLNYSSLSG